MMTTQETQEIQRVATVLVGACADFFSTATLRWALLRLEPLAAPDPLGIAEKLIDAMLADWDANHGRYIGTRTLPVCFTACSPSAPCSGEIAGIAIAHAPLSGTWIVDGRSYPADRVAAERQCRKLAALAKLAAELGLGVRAK